MPSAALPLHATPDDLEPIRARMRVTLAMLDQLIADRCEPGPTIEQISAGGTVLLFKDLSDEAERVGE